MGNETGSRRTDFVKEKPRCSYVVWLTMPKPTLKRQRQLPTDALSCGTQPAHIRMIIVVYVYTGSLFHFPWKG
jgi:hypothetical protein